MTTMPGSSAPGRHLVTAALTALVALSLAAQEPSPPAAVVIREPLGITPEREQRVADVIGDLFQGGSVHALPGLDRDPAGELGLSFSEAFDIVRGNQSALQTVRDRECRDVTIASCGTDLPVRARKVVDRYDDLASQTLGQLAEALRQSSGAGARTAVVFVSSGLPFRAEPRRGFEAVRDALGKSGRTLLVVDASTDDRARAGLTRLVDAAKAERFGTTGDERARLRTRLAVPAALADERVATPATTTSRTTAARPVPAFMKTAIQHAVTFAAQGASLLADEHYVQEVKVRPSMGSMSPGSSAGIIVERRVLDSEVALIQVVDGELWLLARDVLRVDGRVVPDADRIPLPSVHPASTPEALRLFERIAQQGSRFNIGAIPRTLNTPTLAMWLLTPAINPRLEFKRAGTETLDGSVCDVIEFRERTAPYLFVVAGEPTPVSGRVWVDRRRGAVVKTELALPAESVDSSPSRARLIVTYGLDPALSVWVPRTMTERYDSRTSAQFVVTQSSYANFRQFTASGRIIK